jgi:hypothetical protein
MDARFMEGASHLVPTVPRCGPPSWHSDEPLRLLQRPQEFIEAPSLRVASRVIVYRARNGELLRLL